MTITNWKLIDCIEKAIIEYNNKLWRPEDKDKQIREFEYSEDGESAEVPEEVLEKIEALNISIIAQYTPQEELNDIVSQLSKMLDKMQLKCFSFSMLTKGKQISNVDISFVNHINENIENFSMTGVDLSQENSSRFARFKNLQNFRLFKCNISNPQIISEINPKTFVSLEKNKISPEYYNDAFELIKKSNGRIEFSDKELQTISQIYSTCQVKLSDYLRLMDIINFDEIPKLDINFEGEIDFSDNENIVNLLNGKNNITISSTPKNLEKIDCNGELTVPTRIIIKNASELDLETLSRT